jgi:hypothetical protein
MGSVRSGAGVVALAGVVLVAVAGCGSRGTGVSEAQAWAEPARYAYTLQSSCGERLLIGRFRVTVERGAVTKAEALDESAASVLEGRKPDVVPSIGALVAEAAKARADNADKVTVELDPADGHPTKVTIDPYSNAIDDESCYDVTGYTVLSS